MRCVPFLALTAIAFVALACAVATEPPPFFTEVTGMRSEDGHSPVVLRSRYVTLTAATADADAPRLMGSFTVPNLKAAAVGDVVNLNLFDNFSVLVKLKEKVNVSGGRFEFFGKVAMEVLGNYVEVPDSDADLFQRGPHLHGRINVNGKQYEISPRGEGDANDPHQITEVDYTNLHEDERSEVVVLPELHQAQSSERTLRGNALAHAVASGDSDEVVRLAALSDKTVDGDGNVILDCLIVYTASAKAAKGGKEAIEGLAEAAILAGNNALIHSGVKARYRLVHVAEVAYDESDTSCSMGCALGRLRAGSVDNTHALRAQYRADCTSFFTNHPSGAGVGYLAMSTNAYSIQFNVVKWNYAAGYFTWAHETGHNLGNMHDEGNSSQAGLHAHSYGHRWTNNGKTYRSVMSYSPGTRVGMYSTPDKTHTANGGTSVIGTANANNAASMGTIVPTASGYAKANTCTSVPALDATACASVTGCTYHAATQTCNKGSSTPTCASLDKTACANDAACTFCLSADACQANAASCPAAQCAKGKWFNQAAQSCVDCAAGTYGDSTGLTAAAQCKKCPANTASAATGATSLATCQECASDEKSAAGAATCTDVSCPAGRHAYDHQCVACVTNAHCSNGKFCDGAEVCTATKTCAAGTSPCTGTQQCDEGADKCSQCLTAADCDDGKWCNGAETCSSGGQCVSGAARCTSGSDKCDEVNDKCVSCLGNADCDDGLFCNGVESCSSAGQCVAGAAPCAGQTCSETADKCVSCLADADCDDGVWCNGDETCSATGACVGGTARCTGRMCDEAQTRCVDCKTAAHCDNGRFCDGAETCSSAGKCAPGPRPCSVSEKCNEATDTCAECTLNHHCNDGLFCNGLETCNNGVCAAGTPSCKSGETCDETNNRCDACTTDAACDDGLFCTGVETCVAGQCKSGAAPCASGQTCDEAADTCASNECAVDKDCTGGKKCDTTTCVNGKCQSNPEKCPKSNQACVEALGGRCMSLAPRRVRNLRCVLNAARRLVVRWGAYTGRKGLAAPVRYFLRYRRVVGGVEMDASTTPVTGTTFTTPDPVGDGTHLFSVAAYNGHAEANGGTEAENGPETTAVADVEADPTSRCADGEFRCPAGGCVADKATCATPPACDTAAGNELCPDGTCQAAGTCRFDGCPVNMVACPDGTCSKTACTTCFGGLSRCWDDTCAATCPTPPRRRKPQRKTALFGDEAATITLPDAADVSFGELEVPADALAAGGSLTIGPVAGSVGMSDAADGSGTVGVALTPMLDLVARDDSGAVLTDAGSSSVTLAARVTVRMDAAMLGAHAVGDVCLAYVDNDSTADPKPWVCEDENVTIDANGNMVGTTGHFTPFAFVSKSDATTSSSSGSSGSSGGAVALFAAVGAAGAVALTLLAVCAVCVLCCCCAGAALGVKTCLARRGGKNLSCDVRTANTVRNHDAANPVGLVSRMQQASTNPVYAGTNVSEVYIPRA